MFSGIIESVAKVERIEPNGSGLSFYMSSPLASELKVDQSLAHNGVCLTVEDISNGLYKVTAVEETLRKTNLADLKPGDIVNLERSLKVSDRVDGHFVQGHVDCTAVCTAVKDTGGSHLFSFRFPGQYRNLLVEKGSVAVNGVSLTAFDCNDDTFSVTIIPFTFNHTTFNRLSEGDTVNIEFDILGKYFARWMEGREWK